MNTDMEREVKEIYESIKLPADRKQDIYKQIMEWNGVSGSGRQKEDGLEKGHTRKESVMRGKLFKAAAVAFCVLAGSGSVYAAVHYLHPGEVAEKMDEPELAKEFAGLSDHVVTQENDTYKVSYLGEVSGKNLTSHDIDAEKEKTYFVLAVEKKGETPISYEDRITASPFIKGMAPWQFNIFYMGGGNESKIIDNIRYYIFECDNLEIFADRGLYLGVCAMAPGAEEYSFDEKTGEITRNADFKGLNMLFQLDVDQSKADPEKAEEYLKELNEDDDSDDDTDISVSRDGGEDGSEEFYLKDGEDGSVKMVQ